MEFRELLTDCPNKKSPAKAQSRKAAKNAKKTKERELLLGRLNGSNCLWEKRGRSRSE